MKPSTRWQRSGAIFSWSSEYDAAWVDGCGVELYAKGADGCIESYGMDDEYLAEEISSVIQSNIAETEFLAS